MPTIYASKTSSSWRLWKEEVFVKKIAKEFKIPRYLLRENNYFYDAVENDNGIIQIKSWEDCNLVSYYKIVEEDL